MSFVSTPMGMAAVAASLLAIVGGYYWMVA
jgi:hypothetical protein